VDEQTISRIVSEIKPLLEGRPLGKVFQLSRTALAFDFRTRDGRLLFLSVEPGAPRLYMIARRIRDLEKESLASSHFIYAIRKHLGGGTLLSLTKDLDERIVRFSFDVEDAVGEAHRRSLIAQLTGRSANLLLLGELGHIIDALRPPHGEGQEIGDIYRPPPLHEPKTQSAHAALSQGTFPSLSEAADDYYSGLEARRAFESRSAAVRARLRKSIAQRRKLQSRLMSDMAAHGDAEEHKRIGELLLANIGSAERRGQTVIVTDYYAEGTPRIELQVDEHSTLQEEAARRFARYTKARRAAQEISRRLAELEAELASLEAQAVELERIVSAGDEEALSAIDGDRDAPQKAPSAASKKSAESVAGARRYRSSDGYEVLVGRTSRDNDQLTFRVARPFDLWLHAADYPGSHVVVRNPTRKEIPHRTIIEAAQLAANFSQARRDAKVNVHYTQRKFLAKPKGAQPGLVRMSSFRSITVEPREALERI
jgi:predicted ribosome quality control (RQC) complex YloA/Tae2 family protein